MGKVMYNCKYKRVKVKLNEVFVSYHSVWFGYILFCWIGHQTDRILTPIEAWKHYHAIISEVAMAAISTHVQQLP